MKGITSLRLEHTLKKYIKKVPTYLRTLQHLLSTSHFIKNDVLPPRALSATDRTTFDWSEYQY